MLVTRCTILFYVVFHMQRYFNIYFSSNVFLTCTVSAQATFELNVMILHPGGSYVVLRTQVTWHERYIFEQRDIYSFTYIALSRICLSHLLIPLEGASASAHNTAQQGWWCFYFHRMSYVFIVTYPKANFGCQEESKQIRCASFVGESGARGFICHSDSRLWNWNFGVEFGKRFIFCC